jgi:hypothetical protein
MSTENTTPAPAASDKAQTVPQSVTATAKKPVRRPVKKAAAKKTKPNATKAAKAKTIAKPKVPAKTKPALPAKPVEAQKIKKPKLVRDSFTFPKDEYLAIAELKQKALNLKHSAKKSEILRAGLKLLNGLSDKAFLTALSKVPALKTGRPAKE